MGGVWYRRTGCGRHPILSRIRKVKRTPQGHRVVVQDHQPNHPFPLPLHGAWCPPFVGKAGGDQTRRGVRRAFGHAALRQLGSASAPDSASCSASCSAKRSAMTRSYAWHSR